MIPSERKPVIVSGKVLNIYIYPTGKIETANGLAITPVESRGKLMVHWDYYGTTVRFYLDEVVAATFMKKPSKAIRLIHIDKDEYNCCVDNLMWLTENNLIKMYQDEFGLTKKYVMDENWRTVDTDRGPLEVSTLGNVRYPDTKEPVKTYDNHGYRKIVFWKLNGKGTQTLMVHRLVAQAFIPNPENFDIVNHIDCNKANNCVYNLEWCDQSRNTQHAYANNRVVEIPHDKKVQAIQLMLEGGRTDVEISEITGVSRKQLSAYRCGTRGNGIVRQVAEMMNVDPEEALKHKTRYGRWDKEIRDKMVELFRQGKSRDEIFKEMNIKDDGAAHSFYYRLHAEYMRGDFN